MPTVLFDIDGTLIHSGGVGQRALLRSFEDLTNKKIQINPLFLAGRTDYFIIYHLLENYLGGYERHKHERLLELYLQYLAEEIAKSPPKVLPGVYEVLNSLRDQGIRLGLLTGNVREGARLKLGDLYSYFSIGFFGDEEEDRNMLALKARSYLEDEFWIVGDTPHDISCARAGGGKCIAVATGHYSRHELAGADYVLNSLEEWFFYWH
ncbi:MAG: HAD family hydrolase [Leptospiraceae bacterium]|nr:HAD family hydrolase [Leptospiraceae bacterium]MDW8306821.1 HAD family hydrolase [Leptospiraceae bacterium]